MAKKTEIVRSEITPPAVEPETFHQMVGAAKYANYIHNQTKSDVLRFLLRVREERLFIDQGMSSFDEFLNSPLSPMSQGTFYREEKLLLNEREVYDVFNELGIPARIRKELTAGQLSYDGKTLTIGSEQIALNEFDTTIAKQIIERLVRDMISAETKAINAKKAADDYRDQLRESNARGNDLLEENKRFRDQTPFERSMSQLLQAASNVAHCVRHQMHPVIREKRADDDLHTIMVIFSDIAEAYGVAGWQKKLEEIHKREAAAAEEPQTKRKAAAGGKK